MIHQLIFARPKLGLSEQEFQRYWVERHAVEFAQKIPQIRKYLIDTRLPCSVGGVFGGVAEIWLDDVEDQLASLQTPEFLKGARPDEPKWAAYWQTIALDTDAKEMLFADDGCSDEESVKLLVLLKRKQNVSLAEFKSHLNSQRHLADIEKTQAFRYLQCHVRDAAYSLGEPRFDCVLQIWFKKLEIAREVSAALKQSVKSDLGLGSVANPKQMSSMLTKEHWIIEEDGELRRRHSQDQGRNQMAEKEDETRVVAEKWFAAVAAGDGATAATCLDENVEWINYELVEGHNDIMPWIGTYHGRDAVMDSFGVFLSIVEVKYEKLVRLLVSGEEAVGVVHEISTVKNTGKDFEIEFIQWLTIRKGKIVRWKSYTDPSSIIAAMK